MNHKEVIDDPAFIEQELFDTRQALFSATSVRQVRFLQNKLNYLKQKMREVKGK